MKAFLEPLSKEEEQYYIEEFQKGNLEARNTLIERNLRLVAHIAKKYQSKEDSIEDLISIGTYGLMKAVMTYDCSKGNRLGTYSARCIENEILMYMRSKRKTAKDISIYEQIGTDKEGNQLQLMDVLDSGQVDLCDHYEKKEMISCLYEHMEEVLTPREYQIICDRYGLHNKDALTQNMVAEKLGISRSYVSRIEKKALRKLQLFLRA